MLKQKLIYLLLFFSLRVWGDQLSLSFYNDFFVGTDNHFTNGMNLSWLDDSSEKKDVNNSNNFSKISFNLLQNIPFILIDKSKEHSAGLSISQVVVTPTDTTVAVVQYNDMPYAGYLALDFYLFEWDENTFKELRFELGVVGKEAGAKFVQNSFHSLIGNEGAQGWDSQLKTQYTANVLLRYGEITWKKKSVSSLKMDWFNSAGFQVGNFSTMLFGESVLRIGRNYRSDFNLHYPYLKEEASLLKSSKVNQSFGWSLSAGVSAEALAYSYILDEAKKEGYATEKNIINIALYTGLDLYYKVHKFTFFYQAQSPYTSQQNSPDIVGGFAYVYRF